MLYMRSGGAYRFSMSLISLNEGGSLETKKSSPAVKDWFKKILAANDGTPFIPVHNLVKRADDEITALAAAVNDGNAEQALTLLYMNFADPGMPIPSKQNNTALQYACHHLNLKPEDYFLKAIVLLLIMQGKVDNKNAHKQSAMDRLRVPQLFEFKALCQSLLALYKGNREDPHLMDKLIPLHRCIMVQIAIDVIDYKNMNPEQKQSAEQRLFTLSSMADPNNIKDAAKQRFRVL